jgi:hypothetical protein
MMDLRTLQAKRIEKVRESTRQSCLKTLRVDPYESIDWESPDFSVLKLRESCSRMREAVAETSFPQLLRAGVQQFMFDAYNTVPTIFQDLVRVTSSNKYEELYAPLYNSELPVEVLPGEPFPDSRIVGLDVHVRNRKWGRLLAYQRELVDDDMTGQISQRAANLGQLMRYIEELMVAQAIIEARDTFGKVATTGYTTAIGNTPSVPGGLSQAGLEEADVALQNMVDPLGNFILIMPDTVLVSPSDKFNVLKLLNSTLQPSVPGAANQNVTTVPGGTTGWTMTINPLQGEYTAKVTRFLPGSTTKLGGPGLKGPGLDGAHGAWLLMETKKSIVFQDREGLEIVQENPQGGTAFELDEYRYRIRRRFAVECIDSRFLFRGN